MFMHRYFASMVGIKLPDLGEGTKEATVKEWFVKEGQQVNEYDDLCEVFTDKLVAKIPSTHDGVVKKINFGEDEICLVGHALLDLEVQEGAESSDSSASSPAAEEPKSV